MLSGFKRLVFACAAVLALAGCSGNTALPEQSGNVRAYKTWGSWDPLAGPIAVPENEAALAGAPALTAANCELIPLDELNRPAPEMLTALSVKQNAAGLQVHAVKRLPWVYAYLRYDAQAEHPVLIETERADAVSLALIERPGLIALCVAGLNGRALDPRLPLATVRFAPGPGGALAKRASITQDNRSKVTNLSAVSSGDGSATLQWSERHTGDYDLNSLVNVADVVRIGQYFNRTYTPADVNYAQLEVVDGDNNFIVAIPDLVPIAINFNSHIMGYNVYRTPLSTPDEIPDVDDSGRWTKVPNASQPSGPSAPRQWSGQNFRLVYTFIDDCGVGDFGWYVTPAGPSTDVPPEGPKSTSVTLTVEVLPESGLGFEIVAPATDTANVNDEFYLAVKVTGVTGLFSANVRFEYDSTLVQYEAGVPSYAGHINFLDTRVFLEHDYGVDAGAYSLVGFNDTEEQGTPAKDGNGYLGYFKFKALAAGTNASCFRFPQSSTLIYLWGVQYGVPIATPALGTPQSLKVQ